MSIFNISWFFLNIYYMNFSAKGSSYSACSWDFNVFGVENVSFLTMQSFFSLIIDTVCFLSLNILTVNIIVMMLRVSVTMFGMTVTFALTNTIRVVLSCVDRWLVFNDFFNYFLLLSKRNFFVDDFFFSDESFFFQFSFQRFNFSQQH